MGRSPWGDERETHAHRQEVAELHSHQDVKGDSPSYTGGAGHPQRHPEPGRDTRTHTLQETDRRPESRAGHTRTQSGRDVSTPPVGKARQIRKGAGTWRTCIHVRAHVEMVCGEAHRHPLRKSTCARTEPPESRRHATHLHLPWLRSHPGPRVGGDVF